MADLRSYMAGQFHEDQRIVQELEGAIKDVAATFAAVYSGDSSRPWPYEIEPLTALPSPGEPSQSTSAMVAASLLAVADTWPREMTARASSGYPRFGDFPISLKLDHATQHAGTNLGAAIKSVCESLVAQWSGTRNKHITESRTFGRNDPFTLGWALDITSAAGDNAATTLQSRLLDAFALTAREVLKRPSDNSTGRMLGAAIMQPKRGRRVGDSSYILVRLARILRSVTERRELRSKVDEKDPNLLSNLTSDLYVRFEDRLHDHLSFSELPGSRFDPAELAFCLEGMFLTRSDVVGAAILHRVMSVLDRTQEIRGYWRARTPMLYGSRGEVMFPVSIEAANSVLAALALSDGRWKLHDSVGSQYIRVMKRYWQWLRSREAVIQVHGGTRELRGWRSEHVNDPRLIHLWETSQVAEFLVSFRDQLKRAIARTALNLADPAVKKLDMPAPLRGYEKALGRRVEQRKVETWEHVKKVYEPVTCLGSAYEIYELVGESFFCPHLGNDPQKFSFLIYGPPGTGKTTVAATLAWALDYPLVTITVSDFLADGHAAIEARAKDLFDMLKAQPRCVVLFDEIDQFMLDRDSQYFHNQDTVFQFLTPGMLTKLNDLRAAKAVIFIMATNYAERIDPAIKRRGRIDDQLLLLPPDRKRRLSMLDNIKRAAEKNNLEFSEEYKNAYAQKSVFLGYSDLESVMRRSRSVDAESYIAGISTESPPMVPKLYSARFSDRKNRFVGNEKSPTEEFIAMTLLELDAVGLPLDKISDDGIFSILSKCREPFKRIKKFTWDAIWDDDSCERFSVLDPQQVKRLKEVSAKIME